MTSGRYCSGLSNAGPRFCETCNSYKSLDDYMDNGIMPIGVLLVYHDEVM